jgi:hypothetical protein
MLELFKGQLDFDDIKYNMPYKEALLLRDVRVERLKKEREELERERQAEASKQSREAARSKIHLPK